MYLWEIPWTGSIVISFDLSKRHFTFKTSLFSMVCREENSIYSEPIMISGKTLRVDDRCRNFEILYHNQRSGRTHVWTDVKLRYEKPPKNLYVITCENDSKQVNRRRAVRVSINKKSDCSISFLEGKFSCMIYDISVTGVGINMGVSDLTEKKLYHRVVHTHFTDPNTKTRYEIEARILHVTDIDYKTVRCGCEIISVTPSINGYINTVQLHRIARGNLLEEDEYMDISEEASAAAEAAAGEAEVSEPGISETVSDSAMTEISLGEGALCPVCDSGHLHRTSGFYICDECGSMLD